MANKTNFKNSGDDKYPTTEDVIRAQVEANDLLREIKRETAIPQARSSNFIQLLDDLERHSNENKPVKFEEIMMGLMADADDDAKLSGGDLYGQKMLHFFNKHAASRGLDQRSVELIRDAANRERRLAGEAIFFKLPRELRIQLYVLAVQTLKGVAIIFLYLALFFVLYKIIF